MKLVFVPLKDVFKECKGKRQFSIKKDAYRRFSSVSNEMQIGIKKIAALYAFKREIRHREVDIIADLLDELEEAKQRIDEQESRIVKLPEPFKLAKSSSGLTYYYADEVNAALTAAGIRIEGE